MDIRDDPERDTPYRRFKIRTVTPSAKASSSGYTLAADAIRAASQDDASLVDCRDFDVGGPLFNGEPGCCIDAGNIKTVMHDNIGNRIRIEAKIREVLTLQAVPILLGTALSFAALAVWVVYGLANSAIIRNKENAPESLAWTSVQGLGALIGSMLWLPFTLLGTQTAFTPHQIETFILWSLLMGLAGSWLATVLWVAAARRLPLSLAAQLIVAETIFGLGYGFLFEARLPTLTEATGAGLQIAGVCLAVAVFTSGSRKKTGAT